MGKKILYTATVLSHICQFHLPYLQAFQERGDQVHVAARDNLGEKNGLELRYADRYVPIPFQRSPKDPQNLEAYRRLKALIEAEDYDLIVCNTPVGGILTRLAARGARRKGTRVVYIAHGFHFYRGAPRKNWLVFYPLERAFSRLTDLVVTIAEEDAALARARFHCPVGHIHGIGVSPGRYRPASPEERAAMRGAEGLGPEDFAVLCTGELNRNKDQAVLLRAAARVRGEIPGLRVLLAGNGPLEGELKALCGELGLEDAVRFLGYRTDLEKVAPAVDLIVSCSHREGLGLNVIEGMLCGVPVVASENRGHRELVADGESGLLFPAGGVDALAGCLLRMSREADREAMGRAGLERAQAYTVPRVKEELMPLLLGGTADA